MSLTLELKPCNAIFPFKLRLHLASQGGVCFENTCRCADALDGLLRSFNALQRRVTEPRNAPDQVLRSLSFCASIVCIHRSLQQLSIYIAH